VTDEEIVKLLTEVSQRAKSNSKRIDDLERNTEVLIKMASSLRVLATNQKNLSSQIEKIDGKVSRLEEAPAKRWQSLVGYVLASLCSAGIGMIFGTLC
jgi:hypothetical protein